MKLTPTGERGRYLYVCDWIVIKMNLKWGKIDLNSFLGPHFNPHHRKANRKSNCLGNIGIKMPDLSCTQKNIKISLSPGLKDRWNLPSTDVIQSILNSVCNENSIYKKSQKLEKNNKFTALCLNSVHQRIVTMGPDCLIRSLKPNC